MSRRIKPFGISVLFCVFSFCVVVHAFADSGEENSLKNLVVLTETPLQKAERWHPGGILVREIFRQAFLVAARDELGLQTRDAVLREQVEYAGVEPFHVETIVELEKGITYKLSRGSGENRRELFSETIELGPKSSPPYQNLVERCDEWSRGVFVDLLKTEGFKDERTPSEATATISADLAELIDTMAAIPQTAAIRRLHELARAHQESAELLRALTRAYANLGLLTDFHCNLAHKAFKARSLIYAHRLSHIAESNPTTIWHHAYAWALTGRLDISLEKIKLGRRQLDDLKEKVKAGESPPAIPSWGLTIEEYSRQNLRRLWLLARSEKKHCELAYLLAFHSIEFVDDSNLPAVIGEEAINVIPGCFRLHDTYATAVGVSGGHKATRLAPLALNEFLPQQLEAVSGLSDEAKKLAEKSDVGPFGDAWSSLGNRLPKLVRTLVESGDPKKDRGEPSLEFVGRIIEETAFAQVQRRARFMKFMWGVETDVFIAEACPIFKDHRYAKLLDAYKYDETTDVDKLKAEFAPIEITDSDTAFLRFHKLMGSLWKTAAPKETPVRQGYWTLWANADVIRNDKAAIHRDYPQGTKTADEILACSPYEASAIATVIKEDWDRAQDEIDDWIEVTGDRGAISIVLADKYFEIGNLKKAKYWYEKTLRTDASREAFQGLAECYKKVGDFDGFIETMKRFLEEGDDYGLDRSIINVEVAKELMRRQEFDKALPYAEAGARSYSFYSLSCAGCCYEALGRYEKAEEMFRNCAERYDDGRLVWYDFCMRTGKGDMDGARKLARAYAKDHHNSNYTGVLHRLGFFYMNEEELDAALDVFSRAYQIKPEGYFGVPAIVIAHELGKTEIRDKIIAKINAKRLTPGESQPKNWDHRDWLVRSLGNSLKWGKGDWLKNHDIDTYVSELHDQFWAPEYYYLGARWLIASGARDRGLDLMKKAAACRGMRTWYAMLARSYLRQNNLPIPKIDKPLWYVEDDDR